MGSVTRMSIPFQAPRLQGSKALRLQGSKGNALLGALEPWSLGAALPSLPHRSRDLRDHALGVRSLFEAAREHDENVLRAIGSKHESGIVRDPGDRAGLVCHARSIRESCRDPVVELLQEEDLD